MGKKLKAIGPRLAGRGITKASRKNTAEQYRKAKSQQLQKKLDPFTGPDAAPRTVALVPLCEGLDVASARAAIFQSIEDESCTGADSSSSVFYDKRTKQCVACLTAERNFLQLLDNCRLADYICFILSADVPVDDLGLSLIRAAEAQGIAGVKFVVQVRDAKGHLAKLTTD